MFILIHKTDGIYYTEREDTARSAVDSGMYLYIIDCDNKIDKISEDEIEQL